MRLRIIIESDPPPTASPELELFRSVITDRRPKFQALLGSLAVHIAVLALVVGCSRYMTWYHEDDVDWSRFHVEPLRLHLAEPIFFSAKAQGSPPVPAPKNRAGKSTNVPTAYPGAQKGVQLPSARGYMKSSPIILQPDLELQITQVPAALPQIAFWARQAPDLPKPRLREVVTPGRTEAPSDAPKPAGPPVLAVPNREAVVSDVNIAMPPTQASSRPALPVPNKATVPVRLRDVSEPRTASFEAFAGQAIDIIAMAAEPSNARNVEIPRGLQNLPASLAGDGAVQEAERGGPASGAAGVSRDGAAKAPHSPDRHAAAASPQSAPKASDSLGRQTAGGTHQTAAAFSAASVPPQAGVSPHPARAPDVIRIQHPSNGSFDVVITQSAVRDDAPDLAGMLSGNPVYTVYLNVGDRKEWLIEYCVPARANKRTSPYQIDVDDAGSVTPPYPVSTIIPESLREEPTAKRIVLRGLLTATGNLQLMGMPDASSELVHQLVALVSQWQFRPALRNNKAIDVEVLLVIPPRA